MKNIGTKILIGLCIVLFVVTIFEAIVIKNKIATIKNNAAKIENQTNRISELEADKENLVKGNNDLTFEMNRLNGEVERYKELEEKKLHPIEKEVQACMKKENYTTAGMSHCVYKSEEKWEKEIKKFLAELKKPLTNEEYALLLNSQHDWERYRNSQIKFIQKAYRNTKATIYHNYAAADTVAITEKRARYLYWASDIMKMR